VSVSLILLSLPFLSVVFPAFGRFLHNISEVARAERPLIDNLRKMLKERKKLYSNFGGHTDLVQLLLEQDEIRQKNEKVKNSKRTNSYLSFCYVEGTVEGGHNHLELFRIPPCRR
jgi:hypothetical protein